jgi:hypothetical protein
MADRPPNGAAWRTHELCDLPVASLLVIQVAHDQILVGCHMVACVREDRRALRPCHERSGSWPIGFRREDHARLAGIEIMLSPQ